MGASPFRRDHGGQWGFSPFSLDPQEQSALSEINVDATNHFRFPRLHILHHRFFKVQSPLDPIHTYLLPSTPLRYGRLLGSSSSFKVCGISMPLLLCSLIPLISPFSYADFQDLDSFNRAHVRCGVWRHFRCSSGYLLHSMDFQVS